MLVECHSSSGDTRVQT